MNYPTRETIENIKKDIKTGSLSGDYGDYLLMTELWKCTPSEFEEQTEYNILLHKQIFSLKSKEEMIQNKRQDLKNKALQYG